MSNQHLFCSLYESEHNQVVGVFMRDHKVGQYLSQDILAYNDSNTHRILPPVHRSLDLVEPLTKLLDADHEVVDIHVVIPALIDERIMMNACQFIKSINNRRVTLIFYIEDSIEPGSVFKGSPNNEMGVLNLSVVRHNRGPYLPLCDTVIIYDHAAGHSFIKRVKHIDPSLPPKDLIYNNSSYSLR